MGIGEQYELERTGRIDPEKPLRDLAAKLNATDVPTKDKWAALFRPELGGNHPHNAYIEVDIKAASIRETDRHYRWGGFTHPDAKRLVELINGEPPAPAIDYKPTAPRPIMKIAAELVLRKDDPLANEAARALADLQSHITRLSAEWITKAGESRAEAGRIGRTIGGLTDAEERCVVRAEVWESCAAQLIYTANG